MHPHSRPAAGPPLVPCLLALALGPAALVVGLIGFAALVAWTTVFHLGAALADLLGSSEAAPTADD